jgi:hypothetical protein
MLVEEIVRYKLDRGTLPRLRCPIKRDPCTRARRPAGAEPSFGIPSRRAAVPHGPRHFIGPWDDLPIAIAGMRLESVRGFTVGSDRWTIHTGTVLAVFKKHPRLPSIGENLPVFEEWGLFANDHLKRPPWDSSGPIPAGSQWILYLAWDQELGGFRIIRAVY